MPARTRLDRALYAKKWRMENPDYQKQYRFKNRDRINALVRLRRKKNLNKYKAQRRARTWKNITEYRAKRRAYWQKNKERTKKYRRAYYAKNAEKLAARVRAARLRRIASGNPTRPQSQIRYQKRQRWIISRLVAMARDDGIYEALAREYDNGERSLRQTDSRPVHGEEYRREL